VIDLIIIFVTGGAGIKVFLGLAFEEYMNKEKTR